MHYMICASLPRGSGLSPHLADNDDVVRGSFGLCGTRGVFREKCLVLTDDDDVVRGSFAFWGGLFGGYQSPSLLRFS